jgi:hypothetical protein
LNNNAKSFVERLVQMEEMERRYLDIYSQSVEIEKENLKIRQEKAERQEQRDKRSSPILFNTFCSACKQFRQNFFVGIWGGRENWCETAPLPLFAGLKRPQ